MLQMDLPHVNVLSKIDNLANQEPLPFNLDFYTDPTDMEPLLPLLAQEMPSGRRKSDLPEDDDDQLTISKFDKLNRAIIELVTDFALVGFETLVVEDKPSMISLLHAIDRAGGYAFGGAEGANDTVWQVAMRDSMPGKMEVRDVQERWIDRREEFDEMERKSRAEERTMETMQGEDGTDVGDDEFHPGRLPLGNNGIKVVRKNLQ